MTEKSDIKKLNKLKELRFNSGYKVIKPGAETKTFIKS
jgi:hypothetical protein